VEYLNAAVPTVANVHMAVLVDGDRVHRVELTGPGAGCSPRHEEFSVLVELDAARVRVAVADKEGAVGKPVDVGRPAKMLVVVACHAGLAERHDQLLAVI